MKKILFILFTLFSFLLSAQAPIKLTSIEQSPDTGMTVITKDTLGKKLQRYAQPRWLETVLPYRNVSINAERHNFVISNGIIGSFATDTTTNNWILQSYVSGIVADGIGKIGGRNYLTGKTFGLDFSGSTPTVLSGNVGLVLANEQVQDGTMSNDSTYVATVDSAGNLTYIERGVFNQNIFNTDGTLLANRIMYGDNKSLSLRNMSGFSLRGTTATSGWDFVDTANINYLNLVRDNGVDNMVKGQTISSLQIKGRRNGSVATLSRVETKYRGNGGNNRTASLLLGVSETTGFGGYSLNIFSDSLILNKRVVIGYAVDTYPDTYTSNAIVTVNGRDAVDIFATDSVGVRKFAIKSNGDIEATAYPNTRDDTGIAANVISTSSAGVLESRTMRKVFPMFTSQNTNLAFTGGGTLQDVGNLADVTNENTAVFSSTATTITFLEPGVYDVTFSGVIVSDDVIAAGDEWQVTYSNTGSVAPVIYESAQNFPIGDLNRVYFNQTYKIRVTDNSTITPRFLSDTTTDAGTLGFTIMIIKVN